MPLADGRLVRGPRGLLLPGEDLPDASGLDALGLRLAHPEAAHGLLRRGAVPRTPARSVLEEPAVRAAVEAAWTSRTRPRSPTPCWSGRGGRVGPGELPWLADLPLPDADGEPARPASWCCPAGTGRTRRP